MLTVLYLHMQRHAVELFRNMHLTFASNDLLCNCATAHVQGSLQPVPPGAAVDLLVDTDQGCSQLCRPAVR